MVLCFHNDLAIAESILLQLALVQLAVSASDALCGCSATLEKLDLPQTVFRFLQRLVRTAQVLAFA
jgi:hypothetical protein